jgi:hypothetical protein
MIRLWIAVAALCFTQWAVAWQRESVSPKSWSGVIINSGCTVDEAFAEANKCFEKRAQGAKVSLYDDRIRRDRILERASQSKALSKATRFAWPRSGS